MAVSKLRQGKKIVGTMVRMVDHPGIVQIAKNAGLDYVLFDMEHGTYDVQAFANLANLAKSIGLGCFVRIPELSKSYVSRLLDAGATGIMCPMLSTEEEAKKLVEWARYIPIGGRGFGSLGVHTGYGNLKTDALTFMKEQNEQTLAIAQIETKEAIENIDKIAAVDGIDVLLIGPNDLAISLGVPGDIMCDTNVEAIKKVAAAAKKHGKVFSLHAPDALLAKFEDDMKMVMSGLDIGVIANGFKAIADKFKG